MISKPPQLKIHDEQTFQRLRIRYPDKESKKVKYKQISYGRRISKEEAMERMQQFREELLMKLIKELEALRAQQQVNTEQ